MSRYVGIEALARLMGEHAPPAWCKLAIYGAIHISRVQLHASCGRFRAYVPAHQLEPSPLLPPRIRRAPTVNDLSDYYGIDLTAIDHSRDTEIWSEVWEDDPNAIALGWAVFSEPWDWLSATLSFECFQVPSDYSCLFGYDDLHPEGEPDEVLYYDATFGGLCLTVDDAEKIAPMCDLEAVAFGSKNQNPTRKIGRPKRSGFESSDEPIVREMLAEKRANPTLSIRYIAEKHADQAAGHGTRESKTKRLERRLAGYGV